MLCSRRRNLRESEVAGGEVNELMRRLEKIKRKVGKYEEKFEREWVRKMGSLRESGEVREKIRGGVEKQESKFERLLEKGEGSVSGSWGV